MANIQDAVDRVAKDMRSFLKSKEVDTWPYNSVRINLPPVNGLSKNELFVKAMAERCAAEGWRFQGIDDHDAPCIRPAVNIGFTKPEKATPTRRSARIHAKK